MNNPHAFAVDVLQMICDRLKQKAADIQLMVETTSSFEEWLNWEAFLACRQQQVSYPFYEVTAKPTYSSEEVQGDDGHPFKGFGDLRIGGSDDPAKHLWVFAEFALLHDGNRAGDKWRRKIEDDVAKLKRLGWKHSIAMLVIVAASRGNIATEWSGDLEGFAVWNQPPLTEAFAFDLPGGGTVVVKAFDIKQNPADIATNSDK